MFDSGYIILVLLAAILFYMWRSAGRSALNMSALLEKDHHHHIKTIKVITRMPHGTTWKEYSAMASGKDNRKVK